MTPEVTSCTKPVELGGGKRRPELPPEPVVPPEPVDPPVPAEGLLLLQAPPVSATAPAKVVIKRLVSFFMMLGLVWIV